MKPYISLLRVRVLNGLQYRAAALSGLATQFFWGLMLIFIYKAFYGGAADSGGFSYQDLVTYVWLQQAFLSLLMLWDTDTDIRDMIMTGEISYELCRPVNLYRMWYVKLLSRRLSQGALRFAPVVILGFLMPAPYKLAFPQSPAAFLLFVATLFLGLLLLVAISMMAYLSIFMTLSPDGSLLLPAILGEFFAGMTIPLPLMPLWLQKVCMFLPFRWTADFPLRVYSGHIGTSEAIWGLGAQCLWIAFLLATGEFIMRRVTRLAVVQGG